MSCYIIATLKTNKNSSQMLLSGAPDLTEVQSDFYHSLQNTALYGKDKPKPTESGTKEMIRRPTYNVKGHESRTEDVEQSPSTEA